MWQLDCKESWALKNWCFWTVVLEKTLESLLDSKEVKPVHPKGNQSWIFIGIFIGRTDVEAETPTLWPPDGKKWLFGKDPNARKDWRRKRGRQRMRWPDGITDSMDMHLSKLCKLVKAKELWRATVHRAAELDMNERLNWLSRLSMGFPGSAMVKNPSANVRDTRDADSNPGSGRSPGVGNGNPLQHFPLVWEIPWTEKPGRLHSMRSRRVTGPRTHMHACTCVCPLTHRAGFQRTVSNKLGLWLPTAELAPTSTTNSPIHASEQNYFI